MSDDVEESARRRLRIISFVGIIQAQIAFARLHWEDLRTWARELDQLPELPRDVPPPDELVSQHRIAEARIWSTIQALLGCAANVSKVLWPPGQAGAAGRARAQELRTELRIEGDLHRDREVRNALEHIDEGLDDWLGTGQQYVVDFGIVAEVAYEAHGFEPLRTFDPLSLVVRVLRQGQPVRVQLAEVMDALDDLYSRCQGISPGYWG